MTDLLRLYPMTVLGAVCVTMLKFSYLENGVTVYTEQTKVQPWDQQALYMAAVVAILGAICITMPRSLSSKP